MVDGVPIGLADPNAQAAELLRAQLVDDGAKAVVASAAAALAEAELAERERKVVGHDEQVAERRPLPGQDLADGDARVVHVRERLSQREVQPLEPTLNHARRVPLAPAADPARPVRQPVKHHPADVMARLRVLVPGIAQADDDLHKVLLLFVLAGADSRRIAPGRRQHDERLDHIGRARKSTESDSGGADPSGPILPDVRHLRAA